MESKDKGLQPWEDGAVLFTHHLLNSGLHCLAALHHFLEHVALNCAVRDKDVHIVRFRYGCLYELVAVKVLTWIRTLRHARAEVDVNDIALEEPDFVYVDGVRIRD